MKSPADDRDLRDLLSSWRPPPPAPDPRFQSAVWARIEGRPARRFSLPSALGDAVAFLFSRTRAAATATVATAIVIGMTLAISYNRAQANERMLDTYVASIDPLQRVHLDVVASTGAHNHGAHNPHHHDAARP